jgi:transcriptional regulator with XRE-family HTH domain
LTINTVVLKYTTDLKKKGGDIDMEVASGFGEFFKKKRRDLGLTLREFCRINGFDPGNISKIERGLFAPPQSREKRLDYGKALGIKEGTDDWLEFCDLAATSIGKIPSDIVSNHELMNALPVLFRSIRGKGEDPEAEEDKLKKLVESIRKQLR